MRQFELGWFWRWTTTLEWFSCSVYSRRDLQLSDSSTKSFHVSSKGTFKACLQVPFFYLFFLSGDVQKTLSLWEFLLISSLDEVYPSQWLLVMVTIFLCSFRRRSGAGQRMVADTYVRYGDVRNYRLPSFARRHFISIFSGGIENSGWGNSAYSGLKK